MKELGQLEERYRDFEDRQARVIVVSLEDRSTAEETRKEFPHLLVAADQDGDLIRKLRFLHEGASSPHGDDMAAPTTVLIDRAGKVRWLYRADRYIERLSPRELLEEMKKRMAIAGDGAK
jgi:peroxiredoxin